MALWITERLISGQKARRRVNNRWELKIPYKANQGVTLKGDDIKEDSIRKAPAMLQHGRA